MSEVVRRYMPLVITFFTGVIMTMEFFTTIEGVKTTANTLVTWSVILGACVYIGTVNLFRIHGRHVVRRSSGQWYYSASLLIMIVVYAVAGLIIGVGKPQYLWMIDNVITTMGATMYASLCFYMATGAYRALRARNLESALLLVSAFLVIMGNTPLFPSMFPGFSWIRNWIFDVFVVGSFRAIRIGIGLGAVAIGLKTIFGMETGYLGRRR